MPRRKKQQVVEEDDYCPGCLEYGMDDYDDPTDHMTPEEIQELAKYISEINGGRGEMLYPDDFIDDEAEEGEEDDEDDEEEEEDEDEDEDEE